MTVTGPTPYVHIIETQIRRESALTEQVDAMTLNRSTVQVTEADPARPPHLRVCPPLEAQVAVPAVREVRPRPAHLPGRVGEGRDETLFSREELSLISLFADGLCIEAIARRLDLSDRTIRRRSRALCDRLGVVSTIQVVAWAARRKLI